MLSCPREPCEVGIKVAEQPSSQLLGLDVLQVVTGEILDVFNVHVLSDQPYNIHPI